MGEVKEEKVDETKITQTQQLLMAQVKEEKVDETQFWNVLMTLPPKQTTQFCNQVLKPKQEKQRLNLSLTLGSVYCEESKDYQLLSRTSSTIEMTTLNMDSGNVNSAIPGTYLSLARACSLPAETEQKAVGLGAVKGVQRRRVEGGRRLMKERSDRAGVDKFRGADTMPNSPSKIPAWAAASAAKSPAFCRAIVKLKAHNSLPAKAQPRGIISSIYLLLHSNFIRSLCILFCLLNALALDSCYIAMILYVKKTWISGCINIVFAFANTTYKLIARL